MVFGGLCTILRALLVQSIPGNKTLEFTSPTCICCITFFHNASIDIRASFVSTFTGDILIHCYLPNVLPLDCSMNADSQATLFIQLELNRLNHLSYLTGAYPMVPSSILQTRTAWVVLDLSPITNQQFESGRANLLVLFGNTV